MAVSSPEAWDRFNRFIPPRPVFERESAWIDVPRERSAELLADIAPSVVRSRDGGPAVRLGQGMASPVRVASSLMRLGFGTGAGRAEPDFRVVSHASSRSGRTLTLQQQAEGRDVVGATVKVHFGRSGDFVLTGRALSNLRLRSPRASVRTTAEAAGAAAAGALDLPRESVHAVELQSFPVADDEATWVWRVSLVSDEPVADVRAYLDATTLELTLSYNIASAVSAPANVYPRNPKASPAIQRQLIELDQGPPFRLAGARLVVTPSRVPPLLRPVPDLLVRETDLEFDEPNAYYHLRRGLRYFTALKGRRRPFASPPFRPVSAIVRHRPSRNNSFYVPDTGQLLFGSFDVGSSALSAEMLYHELGHAISDNASKLSRGLAGSQSRGLSEGYSDYFADSALDNPWMCDWVAPAFARNAADPGLRFAAGFTGLEHDTGAVWSAVLWGIRSRIGQADADRIAFESLYLVGPGSTFEDGRRALHSANKELFVGGKIAQDGAAVIDQEWARRS
jgi:hypothetical protein